MIRRKFDKAHKISAVKLILEEDYSVEDVSHELDIHAISLYRWVSEYEAYGENAFPGNGSAFFMLLMPNRKFVVLKKRMNH